MVCQMRDGRFIYVDRTKAIAQLDATTFHSCLWSPRRTGKSLLANQLTLWHDKAITKEKVYIAFDWAFYFVQLLIFVVFPACGAVLRHIYRTNPSAQAGKYLVLAMVFSLVNEKDVARSFTNAVNASVFYCLEMYRKAGLLKEPVAIDDHDFTSSLSSLASAVRLSGQQLSLIVDSTRSIR